MEVLVPRGQASQDITLTCPANQCSLSNKSSPEPSGLGSGEMFTAPCPQSPVSTKEVWMKSTIMVEMQNTFLGRDA